MCYNFKYSLIVSLMIDTLENQFDCILHVLAFIDKGKNSNKRKRQKELCFIFICFLFQGMEKKGSGKKIKVTAKLHGG